MSSKKEEGLSLTIDRDQSTALTIMISYCVHSDDFVNMVAEQATSEQLHALSEFIGNLSSEIHKKGWCEDPDCRHNGIVYKEINSN